MSLVLEGAKNAAPATSNTSATATAPTATTTPRRRRDDAGDDDDALFPLILVAIDLLPFPFVLAEEEGAPLASPLASLAALEDDAPLGEVPMCVDSFLSLSRAGYEKEKRKKKVLMPDRVGESDAHNICFLFFENSEQKKFFSVSRKNLLSFDSLFSFLFLFFFSFRIFFLLSRDSELFSLRIASHHKKNQKK